ncbi:ABC transporter permease [Halomarina rubra]|uniref:ABC transporter permease n=1 Tax=Halomarina rubra TaxID=2071873 RepID=A0ABD6AV97_9EURY|nr:ABC transporter permease [Halomarina rubra]
MHWRESVGLAWDAVQSHRIRSLLTTIGVVIGVGAIIALITLSGSLQAGLVGNLAGDASTLNVWAGPTATPDTIGSGARPVFTERDRVAIEQLESVEQVLVRGSVGLSAIELGNDTVAGRGAVAVDAAYFESIRFESGRGFNSGERAVVVNPAGAGLFRDNLTVGSTVQLTPPRGEPVDAKVVGILPDSNAVDPFDGLGEKPRFYVPIDPFYQQSTTLQGVNESTVVYPIMFVRPTSVSEATTAREAVRSYLEDDSDAATLMPQGYAFSIQTTGQFLTVLLSFVRTLSLFVLGVAIIALVVGSVGIANVMLVSVTERTHEVGVLRAIGAQRREILTLFLIEAGLIGIIGSAIGVAVGLLAGYVGTVILEVPFVIFWEWTGLAFSVGVAVGILSGVYPAWRASRIEPTQAMGYE